jgi:hypothetical protein
MSANEPTPAAITIPFDRLPTDLYIRGPRYPVQMDRIVTPRFARDVDEMQTWSMDIREVLSQNAVLPLATYRSVLLQNVRLSHNQTKVVIKGEQPGDEWEMPGRSYGEAHIDRMAGPSHVVREFVNDFSDVTRPSSMELETATATWCLHNCILSVVGESAYAGNAAVTGQVQLLFTSYSRQPRQRDKPQRKRTLPMPKAPPTYTPAANSRKCPASA